METILIDDIADQITDKNLYRLFEESIGTPEYHSDHEAEYPLYLDDKNGAVFFRTSDSDDINHTLLRYVTAREILYECAANEIVKKLIYRYEQR